VTVDERHWLVERFEENRTHLRRVAYRMLGSRSEADDAVQEAWLRLSRSDASGVENLGGWLTTVVARVCLDMLRSRKARREEPLDARGPEPTVSREDGVDPEQEALLTDSVGLALLVVGDFEALFALLDPDVVLRADSAAVQMGASKEVRGAAAVAETFKGRARVAQPALVNGAVGLVWAPGGQPRVVFGLTIAGGKIVAIDLVADPERLRQLDVTVLEDRPGAR
jgi:RNA polymerase sigma factor (sigma-70 family)